MKVAEETCCKSFLSRSAMVRNLENLGLFGAFRSTEARTPRFDRPGQLHPGLADGVSDARTSGGASGALPIGFQGVADIPCLPKAFCVGPYRFSVCLECRQ